MVFWKNALKLRITKNTWIFKLVQICSEPSLQIYIWKTRNCKVFYIFFLIIRLRWALNNFHFNELFLKFHRKFSFWKFSLTRSAMFNLALKLHCAALKAKITYNEVSTLFISESPLADQANCIQIKVLH